MLGKIDYWRVSCIWSIYRLTEFHAIWAWKVVIKGLNTLQIHLSHLFLSLKILKPVSLFLQPQESHFLFIFIFLISRALHVSSIPTRLPWAPGRWNGLSEESARGKSVGYHQEEVCMVYKHVIIRFQPNTSIGKSVQWENSDLKPLVSDLLVDSNYERDLIASKTLTSTQPLD